MLVTLWLCQNSYWKMAIEIVDLPINSMVIFHRFLYVDQAGYITYTLGHWGQVMLHGVGKSIAC